MKLSSLEFSFEMNEQSYIKASKINALSKKDLEAQRRRTADLLQAVPSVTHAS